MLTHRLARPLLAAIFITGGIDSVLHPASKAPAADKVVGGLPDTLGMNARTEDLVRLNGAVQLGGGLLLALGVFPRLASTALLGSLVPTTMAGHRFWEDTDDKNRAAQRIHFLKNVAMLGGLLLAATDTDGRPSLGWRAHRSREHAAEHLPAPVGHS